MIPHHPRPCRAPSCTAVGVAGSSFCAFHRWRATDYGHPEGIFISPALLAPHLNEACEILGLAEGRADIAAAEAWLTELIQRPSSVLLRRHTAHLRDRGVTARAAMLQLTAIWMLSVKSPSTLVDDGRLTWALGRAVIRLARMPRVRGGARRLHTPRIRKAVIRDLGLLVREALGVLLQRLVVERQASQAKLRALREVIRTGTPQEVQP